MGPAPPSAESTAGEEERERDGRRRQGGVARAGEATPAPPTADPPQLDVFLAAVEARRPIPVEEGERMGGGRWGHNKKM
jgi:hypothetical protein